MLDLSLSGLGAPSWSFEREADLVANLVELVRLAEHPASRKMILRQRSLTVGIPVHLERPPASEVSIGGGDRQHGV